MSLPETKAKSVEERRKEIIREDYIIGSYSSYDTFSITPFDGLTENIRFFEGGVEAFVEIDVDNENLTNFIFNLVDQREKTIMEYIIGDTPESY